MPSPVAANTDVPAVSKDPMDFCVRPGSTVSHEAPLFFDIPKTPVPVAATRQGVPDVGVTPARATTIEFGSPVLALVQ